MRISSVGSRSRRESAREGVTLVELIVAMALAAMVMALSFPSIAGGLDGVRLQSAARRFAAFLNNAQQHAERDQTPVELVVEAGRGVVRAISADGVWDRTLELEGVRLAIRDPEAETERFVLFPGVPTPRMRFQLTTPRGQSLAVESNPLTGVPLIEEVR